MATFFGKAQKTLNRLRKCEYQNIKEKLDLLAQLQQEYPDPCECVWLLTFHDAKYREVGIEIIKKDSSRKMLEALLAEIKIRPIPGKKHVVPLLARLQPYGLYKYLKKTITSHNKEERLLCMEIVSQYKVRKRIERYLFIFEEALGDPDENIRYLAVHSLTAHVADKKIFFLLFPLLQDIVQPIRHQAIVALSSTNSPDLVQPFLDRLGSEPHAIQAILIKTLSRLAQNPDLQIEKKIIPVLADENEVAREAAAQLLAKMPNKRAIVGKFLLYTRGIAFWLRERIFESLGKISESIADVLLEFLEGQDESIRIDAMFMAAYMNDRRIVPGVLSVLDSDLDWWVRLSAIEVLVKFRVPDLIRVFSKYQQDPDLKWAIISAYGELQCIGALDFLKSCLHNNECSIKRAALRSLEKMIDKDREIVLLIEEIAKSERDWAVRTEACQILENTGRAIPEKVKKTQLDRDQVIAELKQMGIEMEEENLSNIAEPAAEMEPEEGSGDAQVVVREKSAIKIRVLDAREEKYSPSSDNDELVVANKDIVNALPTNMGNAILPQEGLPQQQADLLKKLRKIQAKVPKIPIQDEPGKKLTPAKPELNLEHTRLKRKITLSLPKMKRDEKGQ